MNKDTEDRRSLEIGELREVKYEDIKDFPASVSYEVYREASAITKAIVQENLNFQKENRGVSGTHMRNMEQIYNIIFFTGARGAGKTSTMLSFMEYLKDYYREAKQLRREKSLNSFYLGEDNYMFTGLEYINASALDEKEDIMSSVLSKMMKKWQDEERRSYGSQGIRRDDDYAYKKRQICMHFSKVYKCMKNVRSKSDLMQEDDDSFMETLQNLSLTWNLKCAFQELVY